MNHSFAVSSRTKTLASLGVLFLVAITIASCKGKQEAAPLPSGIQTLTGVVASADISLMRRGTHVLRVNNIDTYFLESAAVNLRQYEQKELVLKGVLEHNSDPDALPVLVVGQIVQVLEETLKDWQLRSLKISLKVPELWEGVVKEGRTEFRIAGVDHTIVTIVSDTSDEVPTGIPIAVGQKRAVRQVDEATGDQKVFLLRKEDMLVFSFTPGESELADGFRADWLRMLKSISLHEDAVDNIPKTGTGGGMPCGGSAGILCPGGYYCDVTHLEENIGICKGM